MALAEKVIAAAPRVLIDRAPAADPADRLTGNPAAADLTPAAAGIERRESMRLCDRHWSAVVRALSSIDHLPRAFDVQDAIVGMAVFLAADEVTALIDNGCPVCFLAERVRDPFAYDGLIAIAAKHVLGGAS